MRPYQKPRAPTPNDNWVGIFATVCLCRTMYPAYVPPGQGRWRECGPAAQTPWAQALAGCPWSTSGPPASRSVIAFMLFMLTLILELLS
jgi:hypothetical protein